jgi:transaldolase/glucose-6-phosphate isomerase
LNEQHFQLGPVVKQRVEELMEDWRSNGKIRRLWAGDSSLWSGADEGQWLGWLRSTDGALAKLDQYRSFAGEVRKEGLTHAVLLGMGGSSLGPEVLTETLGHSPGWPKLIVLDSTDPAQISAVEATVDMKTTMFIVSSKSGSTIEPKVLMGHFFERLSKISGKVGAARRFVAITDPGSQLEKFAQQNGFWRILQGEPTIGGRYSVLSPFGLVPAAAAGYDVSALLESALVMIRSCGPDVPPAENPGVLLGLAMAAAQLAGRDKVTILSAPELASFGAWAEQLIAESTGKNGKALIPVAGETLGAPEVYGPDRLFVEICTSNSNSKHSAAIDALTKAGHPVVRIVLESNEQLGQEFFRFELATAVAGSLMGLNPFDQPDVEESKAKARKLAEAYEATGSIPADPSIASDETIAVHADAAYAQKLGLETGKSVEACLQAHLRQIRPGDYFAILAYLDRNPGNTELLQSARLAVRDQQRVATCLCFGPRFLHSTGQAYKGGPNSGVFLQITADDRVDLSIPGGHTATFGVLKASQAHADLAVLASRNRRALRVHLKGDTKSGLARLRDAVVRALS